MAFDEKPLVILGFKVGDPECIERWANEGYLPTIDSIMQRGCWGKISGQERVCEHGSGTSLFSGLSLIQHGHYYFRQLKPGSYELESKIPGEVDAKPFWSSLQTGEKKAAIIDLPDIYSLPGLPGIQLVNWSFQQFGTVAQPLSTEPPEVLEDVLLNIGQPIPVPKLKQDSTFEEDLQTYRDLLQSVEQKGKLCRYISARDSFNLLVAAFDETHMASHIFWKYRPEAQTEGTKDEDNDLIYAIRNIYQAIDKQLGLILEEISEQANIIIFSLFGMQNQYPTSGLNEAFFHKLGYQCKNSVSAAPRPIDLIRLLLPQALRTALSQYLSKEIQENLVADVFSKGTDWKKTKAFAIPSLNTCFVRVNLSGREPEGIVQPGEEYESLLDSLEEDFKQLIDPETGEPAIDEIIRTNSVFSGGPPDALPDMFVEWKSSARFLKRIEHPRAVLTQQQPAYCPDSEETLRGFVAAAGPLITGRGSIGQISLLDMAPTLLTLMNEQIPENMTGKSVEAIVGSKEK